MDAILASTPPRKRAASRVAKTVDTSKQKCTVHFTTEADRRLGVFAVMTGRTRSEVLEDLVMQHLKRFVVSDRAKMPEDATGITSAN